jgi:hypothetical protein
MHDAFSSWRISHRCTEINELVAKDKLSLGIIAGEITSEVSKQAPFELAMHSVQNLDGIDDKLERHRPISNTSCRKACTVLCINQR